MQNGIEGIAFDLDGTLYPNHSLNLRLVPFVLKEWRLLSAFGKARNIIRKEQEEKPSELCGDFYGYQARITAGFLSASAEIIKQKIDLLIYRGWEQHFKKIKLFKHSKETLVALRNAGYKMGLLSDFPPETKLKYLGIYETWDAVLCSEQCGALKPHPKSFIDTANAMALPPEKILYVGNSHSYDVRGAAKAGMKTAWIKNRFASESGKSPKPDFSFHNYRQLFDFMLK
jgi:putative hydrolase of the HAD superfamily